MEKLTLDAAVSLLDAQGTASEPEPVAPGAVATPPEPVPPVEPTAAPEGDEATETPAEPGAEPEGEAEPTPEPEAVIARNPPSHWNAEEREAFATLPPNVQDAVLAQEGKRESVLQRAKQEAAEARQKADAERAEVQKRVQFLDQVVPAAMQTFQSRWAGVDWAKLPAEIGAEQTLTLRAQFDAEREQIVTLRAEHQRAEDDRQNEFVIREREVLKTVSPELADAAKGDERKLALRNFLVSEGFPGERLNIMSAKEAAIAYDAMRWREAQKRAAAPKPPIPKPAIVAAQPAKTPAGVRPSAATTTRSPQSARLQALMSKPKLTINEATELQNLKGAAQSA